MRDGSVRISAKTYWAATNPAGGEVLANDW